MRRTSGKPPHARAGGAKARKHEPVRITIRKAKEGDLRAVVRMSAGVKEIENYPGQKMKADDFRHFIGGGDALMLVATVPQSRRPGGKVVGYLTVYRSENSFYLPYAVTDKRWRRRGVADALLAEVERLAKEKKVEYILMSAYAYNSGVHAFLRARGYTPSKRLIQYSKTITKKGKK